MSNVEIAALVIHRKGWDASDAALRRVVAEKTRHVVRRLRRGWWGGRGGCGAFYKPKTARIRSLSASAIEGEERSAM